MSDGGQRGVSGAQPRWTELRRRPGGAVPKASSPNVAPYSPTPLYGDCEYPDCSARARTSCPTCDGDYCRTHAGHPHSPQAPAAR